MESNEGPNRPALLGYGLFNLVTGTIVAVVGVVVTLMSLEPANATGEAVSWSLRGLIILGVIQFGIGIGQIIECLFGEKWHSILGWGCLIGVLALPLFGCFVLWLTN